MVNHRKSGEVLSGDSLNPGLVEGHPHVDSGQVGVSTLDPMAHLKKIFFVKKKNFNFVM